MSRLRWITVFALLFVTLVYAAWYPSILQTYEEWKVSRIQWYMTTYPDTNWNDTLSYFMFHASPMGIAYIIAGLGIASAWVLALGMPAIRQRRR